MVPSELIPSGWYRCIQQAETTSVNYISKTGFNEPQVVNHFGKLASQYIIVERALESPGELIKTQIPGPYLHSFWLSRVGLGSSNLHLLDSDGIILGTIL